MARKRKPGRPKGSKNKRKSSKKKSTRKASRKKTGRKKAAKRSGKLPAAVIVMRAKSLKKNKRAAAIYRDVLGC